MSQNVDCLIVGQGLAGTLLAHELDKRDISHLVMDGLQQTSSTTNASWTAAGMINPVVLKRFSPVWQGRAQIDKARQTLGEIGEILGVTLYYPLDILRIFHDEAERQTWQCKAQTAELSTFLDTACYPAPNALIQAPHGVGKVNFGGRADLHTLLARYRTYLLDNQRLCSQVFDYDTLTLGDTCHYQAIHANHVVFCEGYGIKRNPFFNQLPLNGNKGEVLIVRIPRLSLAACVKSSVFIVPLPERGEDIYFVGSTYHWTQKDSVATAPAKAALLDKLAKILSKKAMQSLEIVEHIAGVRPTVSDRRPLLGRHPIHQNVLILNGLGTRGVMLGATMAAQLTAHLYDHQPLPPAIDIKRFEG